MLALQVALRGASLPTYVSTRINGWAASHRVVLISSYCLRASFTFVQGSIVLFHQAFKLGENVDGVYEASSHTFHSFVWEVAVGIAPWGAASCACVLHRLK